MIGSQKVAKFNNNKQKSKWLTIITTVLQDKCIRETGNVQIVVRLSQSFLSNQIHHAQENFFAKIATDRKDLPLAVAEEVSEAETGAIEAVASKNRCIKETGNVQIVVRLSQSFLSNQIHPEKDSYYAEIVTGRKDLTNLLNKSPSYFTRVIYLTRKLNNLIEFMSGKKSVIKLYADALSGVKI